ncbi:MAG TPA: methyltransferase domain-containing protein [Clostridia bacterium]|nr:methyltransferase domain-containing protein [Clostridia bacterium]
MYKASQASHANAVEQAKQYWEAYIYEQQEDQTDDVEFILSIVGSAPQKIFEVGCGGGRILVPLARAGHTVAGLDLDPDMLARIPAKAQGLSGICYREANALTDDWGGGYDVAVLAGNILVNIDAAEDYKAAQRLFIRKAADCVRDGGHVFLEYNLMRPTHTGRQAYGGERVVFDGTDDHGVYGRFLTMPGEYDADTQMDYGKRKLELTMPNGERHLFIFSRVKHYPTVAQIHDWLREAGMTIMEEYGGFDRCPISEEGRKAVIWARKGL